MVDIPSFRESKQSLLGKRGAKAMVVFAAVLLFILILDATVGFLVILLIPVVALLLVIGLVWLAWRWLRS